jgi:hypothetical protein
MPGTERRRPRIDVRKPAVVVNADGMEMDALVLDISSRGFRLEADEQLRAGELVSLQVDGSLVRGQIVWVLGNEAGGTFLSPVDLSAL